MITPFRIVAASGVLLVTTLFTTLGHAQDARWAPLRADVHIESGLLVIMAGTFIVEGCPEIDVRRVRSTPYMLGLARRAIGLGFSRAEVEEFIDDPTERARVEARADAWLAQRGASRADPASLCQVGRDEITAGSPIGRLLRRG
ncbi:DUF5333 domain-containing protein [Gymnodinialimonas sp. 2305UL16-5]|uniref:DUF5333 domain-containing protein n=1 Tax=Gymnodinialimonas mytili TaxID=3126503 RepID=UPI0030AF6A67